MSSFSGKKALNKPMHMFQLYETSPAAELSISDLVTLAHHRYKVHQQISNLKISTKDPEEFKKKCEMQLRQSGVPFERSTTAPAAYANLPTLESTQLDWLDIDSCSFFALLLVSIGNPTDLNNFIQNEAFIFDFRSEHSLRGFEAKFIPEELLNVREPPIVIEDFVSEDNNYLVPFEIILPFLKPRTIRMKEGKVLLTEKDMQPFVKNLYTLYLRKRINKYKKEKLHQSELATLIKELFDQRIDSHLSRKRKNYDRITASDISAVSRSFPPCMYNMYTSFLNMNKLKHDGRLQFGLFLKDIGLSLEDSVKFWRSGFEKSVGISAFEKQYLYNIRYNYGKEGQCKSFAAYSCFGILKSPDPTADQAHGCPFKTMTDENLVKLIKSMRPKITKQQLEEIMEKRATPQIACVKLFDAVHPEHSYPDAGVTHPNDFFLQSEDVFKEEDRSNS